MDVKFSLNLEFPGFALFDPFNLDAFVKQNNIQETNLLDYFVQNPSIGDLAIQQGVVIPIYSIQEEDYTMFVGFEYQEDNGDLFRFQSYPLQTIGQKLVIADIYSLISWESDFYKSLVCDVFEVPSQYALGIKNGNWSVDVVGFFESNNKFGYKIILNEVDRLLPFAVDGDIDDFDFDVLEYQMSDVTKRMERIAKKRL